MDYFLILSLIVGGSVYYFFFFTPKDSLELNQAISFADDFEEVQKIMLKGYEDNFKEEDFEYIRVWALLLIV